MRPFILIIGLLCLQVTLFSQKPASGGAKAGEIIRKVKKAQEALRTVSYTLERTDTLVTGDTRVMTGEATLSVDKSDTLFGFAYRAKKDDNKGEDVYTGRILYETHDDDKTYAILTGHRLSEALWQSGGQIILPDLVKLDTTGAIGFETWQDGKYIYLRMNYADLTQYDVIRRYKTLTIDPATSLPVAMRRHQETLGKVQDLYYRVRELHVNDPAFQYDFSKPAFLAKYSPQSEQPDKQIPDLKGPGSPFSLKGQDAPVFVLPAFDDRSIALADFRGKPVLLDFWEVWCGPCMESMPKVEQLYETYKDRGLQVFGVINDVKQLAPSKLLVQKRGTAFPTLIGNERFKKDYKLGAVPLYVLIDRTGKIVFVSIGYSPELETAIRKAIG